ncbi:MAG: response regulator transcription factor [Candidatus Aminicenantes bacterium]|nr:response regulator transcription factor [Candidatus Aminicenantes bacterium]
MPPRVLLVEDDQTLMRSLAYILEQDGFTVRMSGSGEEALETAREFMPDLILLDVKLPGISGYDVSRILRQDYRTSGIFIVMLTGRTLTADIIRGLESFADDYITKPFDPQVLTARIRAVLRRKAKIDDPPPAVLKRGLVTVNLESHEVTVGIRPVPLTKTEFDMLVCLTRRPNIVLSRSQILSAIREDDYAITERIVDYQISGLRRKLREAGECIETIRGVGYKFRA